MLKDILPAGGRKVAYTVYAVLGLIIGATQVGFTSAAADQPTWLTVTLAVYAYVGIAIGATAASNTSSDDAGDG